MWQKVLSSQLAWGGIWVLIMGAIFFFSSLSGSPVYYEPPFWLVIQRKGAHVVEYFFLTLVSFRLFRLWFPEESGKRVGLLAVGWAAMFAATDELHQYFSPFRGAHLRDVGIDLLGIFLASILLIILFRKK
jgi:VanZ family protein